jgi:hypothetical protein
MVKLLLLCANFAGNRAKGNEACFAQMSKSTPPGRNFAFPLLRWTPRVILIIPPTHHPLFLPTQPAPLSHRAGLTIAICWYRDLVTALQVVQLGE